MLATRTRSLPPGTPGSVAPTATVSSLLGQQGTAAHETTDDVPARHGRLAASRRGASETIFCCLGCVRRNGRLRREASARHAAVPQEEGGITSRITQANTSPSQVFRFSLAFTFLTTHREKKKTNHPTTQPKPQQNRPENGLLIKTPVAMFRGETRRWPSPSFAREPEHLAETSTKNPSRRLPAAAAALGSLREAPRAFHCQSRNTSGGTEPPLRLSRSGTEPRRGSTGWISRGETQGEKRRNIGNRETNFSTLKERQGLQTRPVPCLILPSPI